MLSHYRLAEKIGEGGMGVVWKAEDTRLGRTVALKFLSESFAGESLALERFRREARSAAALNHPNICTIHEVGEAEGHPFLAMEMLEGRSVRELIGEGALDFDTLLTLVVPLADALDLAHTQGLIHRDLKPGNLFVTSRRQPKILDFGLAKPAEPVDAAAAGTQAATVDAQNLTSPGTAVGTVAYMSPEQARGGKLDARSDLFSFGAVLYEMATGRQAFAGTSAADTYDAIFNKPPTPVSRLNPDLPDEFQHIVDKLLEKDPDLRYQHASELLADLKRLRRDTTSGQSVALPAAKDTADGHSDTAVALGLLRRQRVGIAVTLSILVVLAVVVTVFLPDGAEGPTVPPSSLAVIAFENLADPADSDHAGRMLTSLLTTELSNAGHLQVVSSQRLFDIAAQLGGDGRAIDRSLATQVAQRAGVGAMLLGEIARLGDRLIVTTQLVEVETGRLLGSQKTEGRSLEEIFRMAEALGEQVREVMPGSRLTAPDSAPSPARADLAAQLTASVPAYQAFVAGKEYLQRRDFERAAEQFEHAVELDPGFAQGYYRLSLARSWLLQGQSAQAIEAAERAAALADGLPPLQQDLIRANSFYERGDLAGALPLLESVLNRDPENKDALYQLSEVYMHSLTDSNPAEAIRLMEKLLELDPSFQLVYDHLVTAYADLGRWEQAWQALERCERDDPSMAGTIRWRLHEIEGRPEEALQLWSSTEPGDDYSKGALYIYLSDWEKAEEFYIDSSHPEAERAHGLLAIGLYHSLRGRLDQARQFYGQAAKQGDPRTTQSDGFDAVAALFLLADLAFLQGDTAGASSLAGRALALVPDAPHSLLLAGRMALRADNGETARNHLQRLQVLQPRSRNGAKELYRDALLGEIALAEGRPGEARRLFRTVLDSGLERLDRFAGFGDIGTLCREGLARAALALDDRAAAARALREVVDTRDKRRLHQPVLYVEAFYRLGVLLMEGGDVENGRTYLERFLDHWGEGSPDLPQVQDARRRLQDTQRAGG